MNFTTDAFLKCVLLLFIQLSSCWCDDVDEKFLFKNVISTFPDRLSPPGLKAPTKLWWAKEITPDLHVCGRLSRHNLRQAVDAGFKSILSLFTHPDGDPEGDFGGESLPTTEVERKFVEGTLGLQFVSVLEPLDEWASVEAVEKLTAIIPHLKKPVLLRCDRGYTITFVTLMYMVNQTRHDPSFWPTMSSRKFYDLSQLMGLDFLSRIPLEVMAEVSEEEPPNSFFIKFFTPKYVPEDWLDYWFAHPVHQNWFFAGQIMSSHLAPLHEFGYKSVINLRLGLIHKGEKSQEEVNLLNIKAGTGTYGDEDKQPRQHIDRLQETRIDSNRSNSFISDSSDLNFELQNPREFGDEIGYNEQLERKAFENVGLEYIHLPLADVTELKEFFKKNKKKLMEVSKRGPVLVHCSDGARAAYVSVLAAALQYDQTLDWALSRLKQSGHGVGSDRNELVYSLYKDLLPPDSVQVDHHDEF